MSPAPTGRHALGIVWFRQDLRLRDNPALAAAAASCETVLPLFIDERADGAALDGGHRPGAASRAWLHASLDSLAGELRSLGSALAVAAGEPLEVLQRVAAASGATRIFWNRRYDPASIEVDKRVKAALGALEPRTFKGSLLYEPWEVLKGDGTPYRVFTPYWRAVAARIGRDGIDAPPDAPSSLGDWREAVRAGELSTGIASLGLLPAWDWHAAMLAHWQVGEHGARERLTGFLRGAPGGAAIDAYDERRNLPGEDGTSRLSPHLHHGELSPRQVLAAVTRGRPLDALGDGETTFVKEVVWREFAHLLLFHYPDTLEVPLDRRFERFRWREDATSESDLDAWRRGMTGVPIVDAGMRQLYTTGWMHNRVRMIVASYLVKNLLLPWQVGEAWFRDTLVDADLANNTAGWQWVAGCGADAAPYFRVFNPVLQGRKFDRDGGYVRRWVPELDGLSDKWLHAPWEAPAEVCRELDTAAADSPGYPPPLVDLKESRARALEAFAKIK